jgi:hypothetical protein
MGMMMDIIAAATFFTEEANARELWRPAGLAGKQESLLCMAYLPAPVAAFSL